MPQLVGKQVGEIGYGLMGHTWRPNPAPEPQLMAAMRKAVESGANVWSGAEFYGPPEYNSLVLLERYLTKYPEDADKIVIAIKGAAGNAMEETDYNNPKGIRESLDHVISQLKGTKKIDLFGPARRTPHSASIEESIGTIQKEYVDTGKIGGILLSEVNAATIEESVKYGKIDAIEAELSMWSPDVLTNGVAAACAKHGITLLAYSPLGRGFLTGQIRKPEDFPEGDFRRTMPRFQPEVFDLNLQLVDQVTKLAEKKGITPGQLAVSWVKGLSKRPGMPTIIPIPGAVHEKRVAENVVYVDLSDAEMKEIDDTLAKFEVKGDRYWAGHPIEG